MPSAGCFSRTDAGGTGLNLQAADTVMHLEVPWNPAVLDQRTARVHRWVRSGPCGYCNLVDARHDRRAGARGAGPKVGTVRGLV